MRRPSPRARRLCAFPSTANPLGCAASASRRASSVSRRDCSPVQPTASRLCRQSRHDPWLTQGLDHGLARYETRHNHRALGARAANAMGRVRNSLITSLSCGLRGTLPTARRPSSRQARSDYARRIARPPPRRTDDFDPTGAFAAKQIDECDSHTSQAPTNAPAAQVRSEQGQTGCR